MPRTRSRSSSTSTSQVRDRGHRRRSTRRAAGPRGRHADADERRRVDRAGARRRAGRRRRRRRGDVARSASREAQERQRRRRGAASRRSRSTAAATIAHVGTADRAACTPGDARQGQLDTELVGRRTIVRARQPITALEYVLGGNSLVVGDADGERLSAGSGCGDATTDADLRLVKAHDFERAGRRDRRDRRLAARQELRDRRRRRLARAPPPDLGAHAARASRPAAPPVAAALAHAEGRRHPRARRRRAGSRATTSATRTPRSPGARCSARSGTRATRSPSTSGSRPAAPTTSSRSSAWCRSSSARSRARSTRCCSRSRSRCWARSTPRSSCTRRQGQGQADGRDHGRAAERRDRLHRRPVAGLARRAQLVPVLLMIVLLPLFGTLGVLLWDRLPRAVRGRLRPGMEVALIVPLLLLGALAAFALGPAGRGGALRRATSRLWLHERPGPASTTSATASSSAWRWASP